MTDRLELTQFSKRSGGVDESSLSVYQDPQASGPVMQWPLPASHIHNSSIRQCMGQKWSPHS